MSLRAQESESRETKPTRASSVALNYWKLDLGSLAKVDPGSVPTPPSSQQKAKQDRAHPHTKPWVSLVLGELGGRDVGRKAAWRWGCLATSNTTLCLQEEKPHADPPRFHIMSQWGKDPTERITWRGLQGLQSPEVQRPRKAFLSRNVTKQRSGYRRTLLLTE